MVGISNQTLDESEVGK